MNYVVKRVNNETIMLCKMDDGGIIYKLYLIEANSFGREFCMLYEDLKKSSLYIEKDLFEYIAQDSELIFF